MFTVKMKMKMKSVAMRVKIFVSSRIFSMHFYHCVMGSFFADFCAVLYVD